MLSEEYVRKAAREALNKYAAGVTTDGNIRSGWPTGRLVQYVLVV